MCARGRRRGTVGAAVRRHGGNARQEGRRINGKGGEARKERHGKERRHGGRPRQRTAEHWAAGKRLGGGKVRRGWWHFGGGLRRMGILPTRYSCSPTAHKMDTSTGGPSQQPGPTPAALVLARSGGMPRVGAVRLAASSAPTRPVPQRAIAARQEEEQGRLAIGPVHALQ